MRGISVSLALSVCLSLCLSLCLSGLHSHFAEKTSTDRRGCHNHSALVAFPTLSVLAECSRLFVITFSTTRSSPLILHTTSSPALLPSSTALLKDKAAVAAVGVSAEKPDVVPPWWQEGVFEHVKHCMAALFWHREPVFSEKVSANKNDSVDGMDGLSLHFAIQSDV